MKTQEEKAKAYDEALEKAKKLYEKGTITESLNYVFPELAESEDEMIRKELIEHIKANKWADYVLFQKFSPDDVIAWLKKQESVEEIVERCKDSWYNEGKIAGMAEGLSDDEKYQQGWHDALKKQGEKPQGKTALEAANEEKVDNANKVEAKDYSSIDPHFWKPVDKVKPKFKQGQWIVWKDKCCKVNYNGCGYELVDQNGLSTSLEYGTADENAHLWDTTKDAKDGDVLVSDNIVFIFNKIHDIWIKCHCSLYEDNSFYGGDFDLMHIKYGKEVFPATKEQRDTLMKAMADAGYEWDAEKKELKKVEPKFKVKYAGSEYNVFEIKESAGVTYYGIEDEPNHIDYIKADTCEIINGGYGVKEDGSSIPTKPAVFSEQTSAWSEEDEKNLKRAIWYVEHSAINVVKDTMLSEWLKSIKERVQPQNNSITDEELEQAKKDAYNDALDKIEYHSGEPTFDDGWSAAIWYLKKRNAQPQNRRKPSDGQIKVCKEVYADILSAKGFDLGTINSELNRLEEQLKKLKE